MGNILIKSFCFIIFPVAILAGCGGPLGNAPTHPGYMDSVVLKSHINIADSSRYFKVIDSLYEIIDKPDVNDLWDKYEFKLRYFYYHKKDYSRAIFYTDSLLQVIGDNKGYTQNPTLYTKSMFLRGNLFLWQGNYNKAYDCYYEARQQIMRTGDSCAFAEYNHSLALVVFHQQKYLEAARYLKLMAEAKSQCYENNYKAFVSRQGTLDNIALCYSRVGMADSADYYFGAALQYIEQNSGFFPDQADFIAIAKAVVWGNQAEAAILRGNDSAAERLLQQSIAVNRLPQHAPEDAVYSRVKLIKLYLKHSNLLMARKVLFDCSIALDTIKNNELKLQLYNLQSRYAAAIHDTVGALAYLTKYIQQKDSLASLTPPVTSADIQASFENLERKNELVQLQQKSRQQAIYIVVLILLGCMAAAIIVLVWRNGRQSAKHVRTLRLTLDALEKSQQDNSRLINVVAHDLRNPIGAMTSFAEITLNETPEGSPLHKMFSLMSRSGNSALGLINDLLHVQTSANPLESEQVDLQELLQYCVTLLQHKAAEKQQQVILHSVPVTIKADREKLWRVFSNIITNAVKFSGARATVTIQVKNEKNNAIVSVEDEGIGIPEELWGEVFDLSGKAKRKGTAGEPSFGLGLVISKQIVELHKGRIWFTSVPGRGTTFYVELPVG